VDARAAIVFRSVDTLRESRAPAITESPHAMVPPAARSALERLQAALACNP